MASASVLKRLEALEKKLQSRKSTQFDRDAANERIRAFLAELAAYDALGSNAERIVWKRRELEEAQRRRLDPERDACAYDPTRTPRTRLDEWRCISLEIDILELEGALSVEQLWVLRSEALESLRTNTKAWPAIPTQDEALAAIEDGTVYGCYQPESLRRHERGTGTLVPDIAGPRSNGFRPADSWSAPATSRFKPGSSKAQLEIDKLLEYRNRGEGYFEPDA